MLIVVSSCEDKFIEELEYMANVPVYADKESLQAEIGSSNPKPISGAGKIMLKGSYLYLVEPYRGIHVIDNSNPSAPVPISFINLPGVVDIASTGNTLYADSFTDLLIIDITNPLEIKLLRKIENVFEQVLPTIDNEYTAVAPDPAEGVVIGWRLTKVVERNELNGSQITWWDGPVEFTSDMVLPQNSGGRSVQPSISGVTGSMARFAVYGDHLFTANLREVIAWRAGGGDQLDQVSNLDIQREVETLFIHGTRLFCGTTSGMVVVEVSSPSTPAVISTLQHATACDPVVVSDSLAYVTLRAGNSCGGWQNQLDVIDVSNIEEPVLLATYAMTNPYGLGVDGKLLFLCDGEDGLKVYDRSDPLSIDQHLIAHYPQMDAYDVIPLSRLLIAISEEGLYQYDYSDPMNITELSFLATQNTTK
ncbi:MAG: hypothetical protein Kow0075_00460 [Salibacteraceae bacterium]